MISLLRKTDQNDVAPEPVRLELSGPVLADALKSLLSGAEVHGGVERYAEALKLNGALVGGDEPDQRAHQTHHG